MSLEVVKNFIECFYFRNITAREEPFGQDNEVIN